MARLGLPLVAVGSLVFAAVYPGDPVARVGAVVVLGLLAATMWLLVEFRTMTAFTAEELEQTTKALRVGEAAIHLGADLIDAHKAVCDYASDVTGIACQAGMQLADLDLDAAQEMMRDLQAKAAVLSEHHPDIAAAIQTYSRSVE